MRDISLVQRDGCVIVGPSPHARMVCRVCGTRDERDDCPGCDAVDYHLRVARRVLLIGYAMRLLKSRGVCWTEWGRSHGIPVSTLYRMSGRRPDRCLRGKALLAASLILLEVYGTDALPVIRPPRPARPSPDYPRIENEFPPSRDMVLFLEEAPAG